MQNGSTSKVDYFAPTTLFRIVLRHRRAIAWTTMVVVVATLAIKLLWPREYGSSASFTPQGRRLPMNLGALAGLAAQFGSSLGSDAAQSPSFYEELMGSPEILGAVASSQYRYPDGDAQVTGTLMDIYKVRGSNSAIRLENAIKKLREDLATSSSLKTGIVRLSVAAKNPVLAHQICANLIEQLTVFNQERRHSLASAERRFTEQRLGQVKSELRAAEDELQGFLQRNRAYANSAELTFQKDRLEREVTLRNQLYTTLATAFEQAKIDEVRDTPLITVIDDPTLPAKPNSRHLPLFGIAALLLGLALGVAIALSRELISNLREGVPTELEEAHLLADQALAELRRPWKLFMGPTSRSRSRPTVHS